MIVTNNTQPATAATGQQPGSSTVAPTESVTLRHNAQQLRRADSNKSGQNVPNNAQQIGSGSGGGGAGAGGPVLANNQLHSPMMNSAGQQRSALTGKPRPSQFQHNVTGNVGGASSVSSPALLHSVSATGTVPLSPHHMATSNERLPCSFHFICSRYLLFVVYLLLLLSLIVNTFLHFIIYGSNMSIGALFIDIHHRYELVIGDYYSLDPHITTAINMNRDQYPWTPHNPSSSPASPNHRPEQLHCDRDNFLSLLDEFYHNPKHSLDNNNNNNNYDADSSRLGDQLFGNPRLQPPSSSSSFSGRAKSYPKIFTNFNRDQQQSPKKSPGSTDEEQLYYSSSSTSSNSRVDEASAASRLTPAESQWQAQKRSEHRLLIIEVAALILLFVLVLTQIIGMVAVMRKHPLLLILVTAVDSVLFCLLVYVSTVGLLTLLLLAVLTGFWFILQLKFGATKSSQKVVRLKEDLAEILREVISQSGGRMTPCVHVSMEQYEAMTQQMLHRYSSPVVYCPHYCESLC